MRLDLAPYIPFRCLILDPRGLLIQPWLTLHTVYQLPHLKFHLPNPAHSAFFPNVQGSCHFLRYNGADDLDSVIKNGAFTLTVSYRDTAKQNGAVFGSTLFNFNAGNSNAIYGKANNVRVSSAQFLMIIKA